MRERDEASAKGGCARSSRDVVWLVAIVIAALIWRLFAFSGFVGLDDAEYARFAHQMLDGTFRITAYQGPPVFPLRIGVIIPAAASFAAFGISEWSLVLPSLVVSVLSLVLVFAVARWRFGIAAGIIAAALWAVLPLDAEDNSTKLVADLPAAFFGALAIVMVVGVHEARSLRPTGRFAAGVLVGLTLGWSWLCKESVAYYAPLFILLLFVTMRDDPRRGLMLWGGLATGAVAVLLGEASWHHAATGDWMLRAHAAQRTQLELKDGFFTEGSRWGWPAGGSYRLALVRRLLVTGPITIFLNPRLLYLPLVGVLAAAYAWIRRDRDLALPVAWLLVLVLTFNFATSHFQYWAPLALFDRYLYPIVFPAVVVAAGLLARLFVSQPGTVGGRRAERAAGVLLVLLLVGSALRQVRDRILVSPDALGWSPQARAVSTLVPPGAVLYTDRLSQAALEFHWRYPRVTGTVNFEGMRSLSGVEDGSYVLVHKTAIEWLKVNSGMWLTNHSPYAWPDITSEEQTLWTVVWKSGPAILYRVKGR